MNYLDDLKKLRKKILGKTIIIIISICVLTILPIIYNNDETILDSIKYVIIFGVVGILVGYWFNKSICKKDIENYKKIYAKNITLEILKDNFEDVKYSPSDDLLPKEFAKVIDNLNIPTVNSYNNDDYISAKYKKMQIEYSDIRMVHTPETQSNLNEKENFKGKWLVLSFDKNFESNIQIVPKIFNGKKTSKMLKGKEYQEIKTSDSELNKNVAIYASNKDEVFNIITPTIINNIKKLYSATKGKIFMFFINNQIHIGIGDKKDFFEPTVYKKFDLEKEKNRIKNQVINIIELIDYWI